MSVWRAFYAAYLDVHSFRSVPALRRDREKDMQARRTRARVAGGRVDGWVAASGARMIGQPVMCEPHTHPYSPTLRPPLPAAALCRLAAGGHAAVAGLLRGAAGPAGAGGRRAAGAHGGCAAAPITTAASAGCAAAPTSAVCLISNVPCFPRNMPPRILPPCLLLNGNGLQSAEEQVLATAQKHSRGGREEGEEMKRQREPSGGRRRQVNSRSGSMAGWWGIVSRQSGWVYERPGIAASTVMGSLGAWQAHITRQPGLGWRASVLAQGGLP